MCFGVALAFVAASFNKITRWACCRVRPSA
jgi:hypothetical protein